MKILDSCWFCIKIHRNCFVLLIVLGLMRVMIIDFQRHFCLRWIKYDWSQILNSKIMIFFSMIFIFARYLKITSYQHYKSLARYFSQILIGFPDILILDCTIIGSVFYGSLTSFGSFSDILDEKIIRDNYICYNF